MESKKREMITKFIDSELIEIKDLYNFELVNNGQKLNKRNEFNEIKGYIDEFLNGYPSNRFIVMPGLRGVGKTTLLYQFYDYLLNTKNVSSNNILFVSFDQLNKIVETDILEMVEIYLENKFNSSLRRLNEEVFIFIDESQNDLDWATSGKIIFDKSKKIFMIFTGSSALHFEYNADAARRLKKRPLTPLNYSEHLKLKYNQDFTKMSDSIKELVFTGNVENASKCEFKMNNKLTEIPNYDLNDWSIFLKYGGFPSLFDKNNPKEIISELVNIIDKITSIDMLNIKNINYNNQILANRVLRFLATQPSGEISQNNLANYFKTSISNVNNVLNILEKTHLIFHFEPYGVASTRARKPWKYYFATSSIRNALSTTIGNTFINLAEYEGILIENQVACNLFNLSVKEFSPISIYFDGNRKTNVDFIIQENFLSPIPIEVGRGDKKTKQIKNAINRYNADWGIVVSNSTRVIEKKDDVIFVPLKTFTFL